MNIQNILCPMLEDIIRNQLPNKDKYVQKSVFFGKGWVFHGCFDSILLGGYISDWGYAYKIFWIGNEKYDLESHKIMNLLLFGCSSGLIIKKESLMTAATAIDTITDKMLKLDSFLDDRIKYAQIFREHNMLFPDTLIATDNGMEIGWHNTDNTHCLEDDRLMTLSRLSCAVHFTLEGEGKGFAITLSDPQKLVNLLTLL